MDRKQDLFWKAEVAKYESTNTFRMAKAGELLAAFELTRLGADISIATEGRAYDLVADIKGKLWRIQVKAASEARKESYYQFSCMHGSAKGNGKAKRYPDDSIDAFAFVALDIKRTMFMPFNEISCKSLLLKPHRFLEREDIALDSFLRTFGTVSKSD